MSVTRQGGCLCGKIRYTLKDDPLIVHACHCKDCQHLSGSAFATNAWTEAFNLSFQDKSDAHLAKCELKGGSGNPHHVFYCPCCSSPIYSTYQSDQFVFVKVGTLDEHLDPDVHIFTKSKMKFVDLSSVEVPVFTEYYRRSEVWKPSSLERLKKFTQPKESSSKP